MNKLVAVAVAAQVACSAPAAGRRAVQKPAPAPKANAAQVAEENARRRAAWDAAAARLERAREAVKALKVTLGPDIAALREATTDLAKAEAEAAGPATYLVSGRLTGYAGQGVLLFGGALPQPSTIDAPGTLLTAAGIVITDPRQGEVIMNHMVHARKLYFYGHMQGVNAFGGPTTLFVYSHTKPPVTARQMEAAQQVPTLKARKAALTARLQPLRDAEVELSEAEDELVDLAPAAR